MDVRSLVLVASGFPDLITPSARVYQITGAALAVSGRQLGVCLFPFGGSIGGEKLSPGEVSRCTGRRPPVCHVLQSKLSPFTVAEVVWMIFGSLV